MDIICYYNLQSVHFEMKIYFTDWFTEFENELKNGDNIKSLQKISKSHYEFEIVTTQYDSRHSNACHVTRPSQTKLHCLALKVNNDISG